eukprot:7589898-Alexandrium_andersonii.AAC.1
MGISADQRNGHVVHKGILGNLNDLLGRIGINPSGFAPGDYLWQWTPVSEPFAILVGDSSLQEFEDEIPPGAPRHGPLGVLDGTGSVVNRQP